MFLGPEVDETFGKGTRQTAAPSGHAGRSVSSKWVSLQNTSLLDSIGHCRYSADNVGLSVSKWCLSGL